MCAGTEATIEARAGKIILKKSAGQQEASVESFAHIAIYAIISANLLPKQVINVQWL